MKAAVLAYTLVLGAASLVPALASAQNAALQSMPGTMIFDVRNGDQNGKLMIKETDLAFESLTDARHSRNWNYADIRELSKRKKELRIKPKKGSSYDFQFKDSKLRDRIYDLISAKVLAARQGAR